MPALRRRLVMLAVVVGTAMSMSVVPATATTQTGYMVEAFYYSDATYTVEVGYEFSGCNPGETFRSGYQTEFVRRYRERCGW